MVKIRLARHGSKKHPVYRIVVTRSESPRDGRFIDQIGSYDPTRSPALVKIDAEKLVAWRARGAQPTATVRQLIDQTIGQQTAPLTPTETVQSPAEPAT